MHEVVVTHNEQKNEITRDSGRKQMMRASIATAANKTQSLTLVVICCQGKTNLVLISKDEATWLTFLSHCIFISAIEAYQYSFLLFVVNS